jgi:nucleoside 2-deoxyribosyltransferase
MFIYEIGALTHLYKTNQFNKAIEWRQKLDNWAKDNGVGTFNPVLTWQKEINHTYGYGLVVDQNDYYINKSDIAVADLNFIDFSPGSIYELTRFKELRKPVIAFSDKMHWSPHINFSITQKVDTLEDVIELLTVEFDQGNF